MYMYRYILGTYLSIYTITRSDILRNCNLDDSCESAYICSTSKNNNLAA